MTPMAVTVAILIVMSFFVALLYVIFGQVTVRKLRNNPETKGRLGADLMSGWDILNVASALSRPKWMNKRVKASSLSALAADQEVLIRNTSPFDRALARTFWVCYVITGASMIVLGLLHLFGIWAQ